MTYAMLEPLKQDVLLSIPPPVGYKVPSAIKGKYSEEQRKKAESDFIQKANSYYSEWFWFAYQSRVWVNCWYESPLCVRIQLCFGLMFNPLYIFHALFPTKGRVMACAVLYTVSNTDGKFQEYHRRFLWCHRLP